MRLAVLLACGCNSILGLSPTRAQDAAIPFFDGHPDAPFVCPADGSPPTFSSDLGQALSQRCSGYSESRLAGRATCGGYAISPQIFTGPIAGALSLRDATSPVTATTDYRIAKLSAEGDELWVYEQYVMGGADATTFEVFVADSTDPATTWTYSYTPTFAVPVLEMSAPTMRGAHRRVIYRGADQKLHEAEEQSAQTWVDVRVYAPMMDLGITGVFEPSLSPDGLRMIATGFVTGGNTIPTVYASRGAITDPFTQAVFVPTAPDAAWPYLADDCGRLYTDGLGYIFYAHE